MNRQKVISEVTLNGNEKCKVLYNHRSDVVVLEIGGTSLTLAACNFFMMNEMIRKAVARLVMQN